MSLYGEASKALQGGGVFGGISSGLDSYLGAASKSIAGAMGGGALANTAAKIATGMAKNAAMKQVNKAIPMQYRYAVDTAGRMVGDIMRGDLEGAGMRALQSGLLDQYIPGMGGVASQVAYWGRPTPLFGGLTPEEARRMADESIRTPRARKNIFMVEVSSRLKGDVSSVFNMMALDLDYAPFTISGEKRRIGGATTDAVTGGEPVELRVTVFDDKVGTLKRWFEAHHAAVSAQDGTVGVPAEYAITIKIVHAFLTRDSNRGGYEEVGVFRAQNMDCSLSRREDALSELQMTFTQLDSFYKAM